MNVSRACLDDCGTSRVSWFTRQCCHEVTLITRAAGNETSGNVSFIILPKSRSPPCKKNSISAILMRHLQNAQVRQKKRLKNKSNKNKYEQNTGEKRKKEFF